jgi:hypothetical protein
MLRDNDEWRRAYCTGWAPGANGGEELAIMVRKATGMWTYGNDHGGKVSEQWCMGHNALLWAPVGAPWSVARAVLFRFTERQSLLCKGNSERQFPWSRLWPRVNAFRVF